MYKIVSEHLCIAISGLSGCGNTSVSKLLAQVLQVEYINYTFRTLAQELNIDFADLHQMADTEDKWDIMVDKKQIALSRIRSCVVGSRLAIWIIPSSSIKIYLEADEEVRARRILQREGGAIETVLQETQERDGKNDLRYKRIYQIDVNSYHTQAEVIINVNNISIEEVVATILERLLQQKLITQS